jgi:hypothetical protein
MGAMQSDPANSTGASLHQNPFWVLWVSTRDPSQRIVESAEEKALFLDPEDCESARATLTNPRKRLAAEMSWLPGVSPARAWQVAGDLRDGSADDRLAAGFPPLARCNALASAIELASADASPAELSERIVALAESADEIETRLIFDHINEDRTIAKFPLVRDVTVIDEEMAERWRAYRNAVRDFLDRQPTSTLVATMNAVADRTTNNGTRLPARLIEALLDGYEVETQSFVDAAMSTLRGLLDKAKTPGSDETAIRATLASVWKLADNWNLVLRPVQLVSKARGLDHSQSMDFAIAIRELGLHLNNDRAMPRIAKDLSLTLQSKFSALAEFAEQLGEDVTTLDEVIKDQSAITRQKEESEKSITYSADVGIFMKRELKISPDGVAWKGKLLPLDSIRVVRWGGTRHSVNGIPTGTTYAIYIASDDTRLVINPRDGATFSSFTDALWRAVGPRIMTEYLVRLRAGESITFGSAIVADDGIVIPRHHFLSSEPVRLGWHQVKVSSADGSFVLASRTDKKVHATLSYSKDDNVHLLETIILTSFKYGHSRLSAALGSQA